MAPVGGMSERSNAARKAWVTRRSPPHKAKQTEKASKEALLGSCRANGWKVLFFESATGSPRTGIVDAIITRLSSSDADSVELRLVQIKAGVAGLTGKEIGRMKQAVDKVLKGWVFAAFDGTDLHFLPEIPDRDGRL